MCCIKNYIGKTSHVQFPLKCRSIKIISWKLNLKMKRLELKKSAIISLKIFTIHENKIITEIINKFQTERWHKSQLSHQRFHLTLISYKNPRIYVTDIALKQFGRNCNFINNTIYQFKMKMSHYYTYSILL